MFSSLFIFSLGAIIGLIPPWLYGKFGGDEHWEARNPKLRKILKMIHHWQLGIIILLLGLIPQYYNYPEMAVFIYGWGLGTAIDDLLFHSFECYFERKMHDSRSNSGV